MNESVPKILAIKRSFALKTVLIFDLSGSVVRAEVLDRALDAATQVLPELTEKQEVAIYGFDGRAAIELLQPFTDSQAALEAAIERLRDRTTVDESTNLYGALPQVLEVLDAEAREAATLDTIFAGTVILFTDGRDQAARFSESAALSAIDGTDHNVCVVGLETDELDEVFLGRAAGGCLAFAESPQALVQSFELVAAQVIAASSRFYELAYCSPKRAGSHVVSVAFLNSTLESSFAADGFGPGCFVPEEEIVDRPIPGACGPLGTTQYLETRRDFAIPWLLRTTGAATEC